MRKFNGAWHIREVIRGFGSSSRCGVHDILFDGPAHRTRFARASPRPHDSDRVGKRGGRRRDRPGRLFALADLGTGRFKQQPGAIACQHRGYPLQCADPGGPPENPAPLTTCAIARLAACLCRIVPSFLSQSLRLPTTCENSSSVGIRQSLLSKKRLFLATFIASNQLTQVPSAEQDTPEKVEPSAHLFQINPLCGSVTVPSLLSLKSSK